MKKILIILILSLTGCVMTAKKYEPQPLVIKEIANNPGTVKAGSLSLYAENYISQAGIDFSKAGLKAVKLTLQNNSKGELTTSHQIVTRDIHGIGSEEYMPYPFLDVVTLLENSTAFKEGLKDVALGTGTGAIIGAGTGAIVGAIGGDPAAAAIGAGVGGFSGGLVSPPYYSSRAMKVIYAEVQSRALPEFISVPPDSKTAGVLFYPHDTHTLRTNIEGVTYNLKIH